MAVAAGDEDAGTMAVTMPVMTTQTAMATPPAVTTMPMMMSPANYDATDKVITNDTWNYVLFPVCYIIELNKNPKSRILIITILC